MNYAVIHIDKSSSTSLGALGAHIDRTMTVGNADPDRLKDNLYYNPELNAMSMNRPELNLSTRVNNRIKEGYTQKRAIKKNAVKSLNIILSGSHEQMIKIEKSGKIMEWMNDNLAFLAEEFGGVENIVSASLHMDERTPHIHATIVPITADGRLSARDYINGRDRLKEIQTNYAAKMKKYGLKRGLTNPYAKHTTTKEFYKTVNETLSVRYNMSVNDKVKAFDTLVAKSKKNALEAKKKDSYGKDYRTNPKPKKTEQTTEKQSEKRRKRGRSH